MQKMCLVCAFTGSFAVFIHTRAVYNVLEKCYGTVNTPSSRETLKKKKNLESFLNIMPTRETRRA